MAKTEVKSEAGEGGRPRPAYPIESVDNALRLLLLFRERSTLRVAEASESIGVARSTAHRLLAMLQFHDFVVRDDETRTYRAGPALVDVGLAVVREMSIRDVARPDLETLEGEVGETVHLAVLDGRDVLFVDSVESNRVVRVGSRIGVRLPAHTTSLGKAMLASLSAEALASMYPDEDLDGPTAGSLKRRKDLFGELEEIRSRGYATNEGESEADIAAIGAAIVGPSKKVHGAISVSAPMERADRAFFSNAEPLLNAVARVGPRLN
jgi:DNA-binding IclR family transcriptional regulator